jgi:hypothetical protein
MNQKFIRKISIGSLLLGSLLVSSLQANAEGFHEGNNNNGIAISSTKFYELLAKTKIEHLGYNFGAPDEIQSLKNTTGTKVGYVWVYHDAVQKGKTMQDAHFVIINGELQYATLFDVT